ncbi:hypothetical protein MBLNU230_g1368t1 [Neophaeotheca triangularis]
MASIFTYEPDPPRVSSPWAKVETPSLKGEDRNDGEQLSEESEALSLSTASETGVKRLDAEPQQGPIEYKLHLLLRPRRKFRSTSTGGNIPGSQHSKFTPGLAIRTASESTLEAGAISGTTTPLTQQTRHHRLEQLTTQLLWRLQQSSPHHTSSASNIILPSLPEALPELRAPQQPAKLLHGLEESQGALYEIGVSDDGTLVGLAEDEMQESINNLMAMAGCLGCTVDVLRKEVVGECEWIEETFIAQKERRMRRSGNLVVVEAFVQPHLSSAAQLTNGRSLNTRHSTAPQLDQSSTTTDQLRVTLTGPTMSGKSSLLGSLTTSTLDNGRGKSRLSMLKHRHEISSGVTSSVTQEMLGYSDLSESGVAIVNYATENVASWIDIHVAAANSRLCLISDSAGHPRYRRTTVKGLVGWAPHWTVLCVPADDAESANGANGSTPGAQQSFGTTVADADLSGAQLDLCLRLGLSLVVVITKLDLASRAGLKASLTKVLDTLKAAGRKPAILPSPSGTTSAESLQSVSDATMAAVRNIFEDYSQPSRGTVPIVLSSALQGTGINSLHALLRELPIPNDPLSTSTNDDGIFHIEDMYSKPSEVEGIIVSGRIRSGQLNVGDVVAIGPFSVLDSNDDSGDSDERPARRRPSQPQLPTSRSFPGALRTTNGTFGDFGFSREEWRRVKIISIRNLRLPVHSLLADQVGTLAIVAVDSQGKAAPEPGVLGVRKGMVLAATQPISSRYFVAQFRREDLDALAVGTQVVVYIASVRASARVISARAPDTPTALDEDKTESSQEGETFNFGEVGDDVDGRNEKVAGSITAPNLLVTFNFENGKEFVQVDDQVLVMPGGGPGIYARQERGQKGVAGLDGFVGTVKEIAG